MKLSAYLSLSRHGVYYFRWPLPRSEGRQRRTIKISLRTRCPDKAGDIARHLASCGRFIRDNSALEGLRQDEIRGKVQAYFKAQLDQYLAWLDRRGLSQNALVDVREEVADHESFMELQSAHPQWLPVARFKRTMEVSDAEWDASLPRIAVELRKGRRDMLRAVLEAAQSLERYSYDEAPAAPLAPPAPYLPASAPLAQAIEDFMAEHSPQWSVEMQNKVRTSLALLLEHFGPDRPLAGISRHDAADMKKLVQALPANRNTKPETRNLTMAEAIALPGLKKITAKTVNSYIDNFRRFWDWAERHGHAPSKVFDGMKVKKATLPLSELTTSDFKIGRRDELVQLKDTKRHLTKYNDTAETQAWRTNLRRLNELLGRTEIGAHKPPTPSIDLDEEYSGEKTDLYRVFNNGSFEQGGRFYGGWWMHAKKHFRRTITINGQPTIEADFKGLHPGNAVCQERQDHSAGPLRASAGCYGQRQVARSRQDDRAIAESW